MLESVGGFVGRFAVYIAAFVGVIALYFLWVAFREWRAGARAMFGVERDIATSEMVGAMARAGILVLIALVVFGVGWLGQQSESDSDGETVEPTRSPVQTSLVLPTATSDGSEPAPTLIPSDTPQPMVTDIPPLPEATATSLPVEPTPQKASVSVFGGLWLRDAPNGGTIVVLPEGTIVELLEGRETANNLEWQKVRVSSAPLGSDAQAGQEGWVAAQYLEVTP